MATVEKVRPLTAKKKLFADIFIRTLNAEASYVEAFNVPKGVAHNRCHELRHRPEVKNYINEQLEKRVLSKENITDRLFEINSFNVSDYLVTDEKGQLKIDAEKLKDDGFGWMIKGIKATKYGMVVELRDLDRAFDQLLRMYNIFDYRPQVSVSVEQKLQETDVLSTKLDIIAERLRAYEGD